MGQEPQEKEVEEAIEIAIKYEGYIGRQVQQISKFKKLEDRLIPQTFQYASMTGFSREVLEKLQRVRPASIGQASRISGVTPAAISLLLVALERDRQNSRTNKCSLT
jgi:tRNA uridine 5-carboxymethylaminomethyl modification enzyme